MTVGFRTTAQGALDEFVLAAAVVLTRGRGEALEVYVVHRSPELRSFPDLWALPGGRVDAGDGDAIGGDIDAFRRCALRELFEETGVAGPGLTEAFASREERETVRAALTDEELDPEASGAAAAAWAAVMARSDDPIAGLEPVCWTTTPRLALRRFRALYVQVECPEGEEPTIHPGELIDGRFARPVELLEEWRDGRLDVVPPLAYMLEAIERNGGDFQAALEDAERRSLEVDEGALHAVFQVPGFEVAPLLTPTVPPAVTTNCVMAGLDRVYVIDPATYDADERARLIAHLERRARSATLEAVVVTHHHRDHTGSVAAVAERFGLPVLAHPLTLERLPDPVADPRPLHGGELLPLGTAPDGAPDWELEVLHTPGHDRGHLALRDTRFRTVMAGDLVSTLSTILIDPPEGHLATYLQTLRDLRDADPGAIIPSHGTTAHRGKRLLDAFLRHRAQREAKLVAALEQHGPAELQTLLAATYDDVPQAMWPVARASLRAGLEKLEEEGRAALADERWSVLA